MSRELFDTRSHSWHAVGLGEELESTSPGRALGGLLVALIVIAATLVVYHQQKEWLPGYGTWVKAGTVIVLVIVGSVAVHWLMRVVSPRLFRRLDPATAGTLGFVIRLFAMSVVVIVALRVAGIRASTLALGGTITRWCSASPRSNRSVGSSPALSCRARGPSGSANGCAWSAAS